MKNINFFLTLCVVMATSLSCGSDDEATSTPAANGVSGVWELTSYSVTDGESVTVLGGVAITEQFTQTGTAFDYTLTFESSPNIVSALGTFTVNEATTFQGATTTESITVTGDIPLGSWSFTGSTLSIVDQLGDIITPTVSEVNETSLIFVLDLTQVSDQTPGGAMISGNATYTFSRL